MAFIERKDPVVLNIKLTSKGRELLSKGELDFKYYAVGDSEIDYDFNREVNAVDSEYTGFDSSILRPADKNPNLISFITKEVSGDTYNDVTISPEGYRVENEVESLGFFTNNNTEFITDANHVKQPDAMIEMGSGKITGGTSITLSKAPTYGSSGQEPAVGDLLFVQWTHGVSTTGMTFSFDKTFPTPNLFYRITEDPIGSLGDGSVTVTVDRNIPNFSGLTMTGASRAMIYYNEINFTGDTILSLSATDYLDESVLSFLENSQCPTVVFPYWNMSIIFTEEIAGVQAGDLKYTQFKDRTFGGFVSYIQNQAPTIKKLGVIHYTNSSPSNIYGEGFLQATPTLDIPTIMWHKSQTTELGLTLSCIGGQQLLAGLNLYYYDLADPLGFVVGKVFPDLKIFVIEDQELLFAMSYKSNRSWTLPDYSATLGAIIPPCPVTTVTWKTPTNEDVGIVKILSQCYCYVSGCTSSGWLPLTVGETISLTNVVNTGYKAVGGVDSGGALYGEVALCICAYDYVNDYCIPRGTGFEICDVYGDPGSSTLPATLSCVNHTSSYCFDGVICNDN